MFRLFQLDGAVIGNVRQHMGLGSLRLDSTPTRFRQVPCFQPAFDRVDSNSESDSN